MCIAALVIALTLGARAQAADRTGSEKAREHFKQGEAFFKLEKFQDALGEYEQGYLARSDASFLYNIAQCHRLMGNKPAALRFYRRFLDEATHVPNREMVEQHIHTLEKALASAPPEPPPPAGPNGTTTAPPPAPLDLRAPPSTSPAGEPALVGASTTATGSATADASSADEPFYRSWWFWPAVGVVAIGAGVGTYLVLRSGSDCPAGRVCM